MAEQTNVEMVVQDAKISPRDKAKIVAAAAKDVATTLNNTRKRLRAKTDRVRQLQYKPLPLTVLSAVGGAAAEVNRRELVGRFAKDGYAQALGLLGSGFLLQVGGEQAGIPVLGPIGAAHAALAGAIAAAKTYGSKDKPDPLTVALEGTTRKAKRDREKKREEEAKSQEENKG